MKGIKFFYITCPKKKEANKIDTATKTCSNLASVKIVPAKIGKNMRSHGIRMQ